MINVWGSVNEPKNERLKSLMIVDKLLVGTFHDIELEQALLVLIWKRDSLVNERCVQIGPAIIAR